MAGQITAIEVQKRNPKRANVFVDGKFAFGLAMIEALKLSKGQILSQDDIERLLQRDQEERAYEGALNFLSYRPRSRAEVARRLREKGFTDAVTEAVTERLCRSKLLDDVAFAQYWIGNRERFKPRGRYALRHELQQKGVESSIIDALIETVDEVEGAYRAASQRLARWKRLPSEVRRRKMGDYLRRRGFGYATIEQVWERLIAEHQIDQDDIDNGEDTTAWDGET
jgi:regulatory protein